MCGRYTVRAHARKLVERFRAEIADAAGIGLFPRYNVAPSQPVPVVIVPSSGVERRLTKMRWGLVPSWSKDANSGIINARSETVATKPSFRNGFKRRRCLIPADGFYEWKAIGEKTKQPFYIRMADEEPFGFAGLWEHWQDANGNELETCAIITTAANELMATIHDRMPVIIDPTDYDRWLDHHDEDTVRVVDLLRPYPADAMIATPVSTYVNKPQNEGPRCVAPIADGAIL